MEELLNYLKELGIQIMLKEKEVYDFFLMKTVFCYFLVITDGEQRIEKQITEEDYIKLTKN